MRESSRLVPIVPGAYAIEAVKPCPRRGFERSCVSIDLLEEGLDGLVERSWQQVRCRANQTVEPRANRRLVRHLCPQRGRPGLNLRESGLLAEGDDQLANGPQP